MKVSLVQCNGRGDKAANLRAVTDRASDGPGSVAANIDLTFLERVRAQIPVAQHKVIGRRIPA